VSSVTYHTVARIGDIPVDQGRMFEVDGRMIAVFLVDGAYYAIDDACPHQGAPLSDGLVADKSVICTWHGWRISLEDGRHMEGSRCRVGTYPVQLAGEEIQIGL
jgi:nitrite reductase (NADH) small subunit